MKKIIWIIVLLTVATGSSWIKPVVVNMREIIKLFAITITSPLFSDDLLQILFTKGIWIIALIVFGCLLTNKEKRKLRNVIGFIVSLFFGLKSILKG